MGGSWWRGMSRPSRHLEMLACLLLLLSFGSLLYILYHRHLVATAPLPPSTPLVPPFPLEQPAAPSLQDAIPVEQETATREGEAVGSEEKERETLKESLMFSAGKSDPRVPVYVVEEHHEVIKYWFAAANRGIIPRKGNVLFHIDGHSDAATPYNNSLLPLFRWPRDSSEIRGMMQANDVFIVGAAVAGLLGRFIWVWPPWDEGANTDHKGSYDAFDITMGTGHRDTPDGDKVLELCGCATLRSDPDESSCFMYNSTSNTNYDSPLYIQPEQCTVQTRGLMEVVSEARAIELLEKGGWLSPSDSVILDVDLDYYGCEAAVTPLYSAGVKQLKLDFMNIWLKKLACISTSREERQLDSFFHDLVHKLMHFKQLCSLDLLPSDLCTLRGHALFNRTGLVQETLDEFKARGLSHCTSSNAHGKTLKRIMLLLWSSTYEQLQAFAEVGICFSMSPKGALFTKENSVKVCDGYNRPNSSIVPFHTPSLSEVAHRTQQLRWMLNWGPVRPRLVTVCRSTRDGYTPRKLFRRIEDDVLRVLRSSFRGVRPDTVTYDPDLLGGRYGWYTRH